ncbi:MAG: hypothetical protein LUG51_11460 [Tannerellaceae bacterium]|nr:hypothetical protein [Tannerellaceae bacterium]
MKRLLFAFMATLFFVSCSSESEEPDYPDPPSVTDPDQEYYEKYCFGFRVKDTTDFKALSFSYFSESQTSYLIGTKSNKLWIGLFNSNNEQIKEYPTDEILELHHSIFIAYKGDVEFEINNIQVLRLIDDGDRWYAMLRMSNTKVNESEKHGCYVVGDFNQATIFYKDKLEEYDIPVDWYNDSLVITVDPDDKSQTNIRTLVDKNGSILIENVQIPSASDFCIYIDYRYYFYYSEYVQHGTQYAIFTKRDGMGEYADNEYIRIPLKEGGRFSSTCKRVDCINNILTVEITVKNYDGKKDYYTVEIDIDNPNYKIIE